ncbi:MAG: GNAT family N-acetyltransferase [Solirubrobacteraceae bacterium]
MEIRPMRAEDVEPIVEIQAALWGPLADADRPSKGRRIHHLLESDPDGAWVAEHEGAVAGCALALLREGIWGLSLLILTEQHHTRGAGRALLAPALAYGANTGGGIILSSEHPAAMRLYAQAGFALRPCVSLTGLVRNRPAAPPGVRDGDASDLAWADEVAQEVRGAGYRDDLRWWLDEGARLRCVKERGWVVSHGPKVSALLALDEEAARALLIAHLARVEPGESVELLFVSAGQDWAVQIGLEAGLALTPDGPIFTRGALGTLSAWIPSGIFL